MKPELTRRARSTEGAIVTTPSPVIACRQNWTSKSWQNDLLLRHFSTGMSKKQKILRKNFIFLFLDLFSEDSVRRIEKKRGMFFLVRKNTNLWRWTFSTFFDLLKFATPPQNAPKRLIKLHPSRVFGYLEIRYTASKCSKPCSKRSIDSFWHFRVAVAQSTDSIRYSVIHHPSQNMLQTVDW